MSALIEARGLTKNYGAFTAVDGIDLTINEGEVFGFLGPNGSGKSTSILMMLGLTEPTAGSVRVCGHDPARNPLAVKRQVGYLPESVGFYGDMSGAQNLRFTAELNRIPRAEAGPRIAELLDTVELEDAANQPVAQYSRGMRQRLGLADVLLKQPRLVILDDPTLGLDPAGIVWLLGLIEELSARQGIAVFLSSHQLQGGAACLPPGWHHVPRQDRAGRHRRGADLPDGRRRLPRDAQGRGRERRVGRGARRAPLRS